MTRIIISLTLCFFASKSFAYSKSNYCDEYGLGWHFYCQEAKKQEDKKQNTKPEKQNEEDYKQQLEKIKQDLEEKKAKAVIYPTEENIKDYMVYQQMVLNKSGTFADQWRRVVWKTPELDYTLKRPVSKVGKETWIDNRNEDVIKSIKNINERYGVFFLFRSDCHFCHKFAPILKSFQEKYGITIMPISMDGGGIPHFDNFTTNKGQVEKMGMEIKAVPATILFDKETRETIPVGFGVLSHSDLEERIYAITKLEVGDDF